MEITNIFQKALPSLINVVVVFGLSSPLLFLKIPVLDKKIIVIGIFFIFTLIFLILNKNRDLGMIIAGTYWKEDYPVWRHLIFDILYTASFATLLFWIKYPFDLFLINMIFLQVPTILLTGTTLHGFLSGYMVTVVK